VHLRPGATSNERGPRRISRGRLEVWYFGDWGSREAAYPLVSPTVSRQERYRNPDAVSGGTWESFERVLKRHGYFKGGLCKTEAARSIAPHIDSARNASPSF
jgi:hypothetical protein